MNPDEISKVVGDVVERVVRRLEDTTHGDLPTPADERMYGERVVRLKHATEHGAVRLVPQAVPVEQCLGFAPLVEHTILRPDAREADILEACREAVERGYAAVCVMIDWVEVVAASLSGSHVRAVASVGFPEGGLATTAKAAEVRSAVRAGADEIDVVMNIDRLRAADYRAAGNDLWKCIDAALGKPVKAVIEVAGLAPEQKVAAAVIAKTCGAAFVKSSTAFGPDAVTVGDVATVRAALAGRPAPPETPEFAARVGAAVSLEISS